MLVFCAKQIYRSSSQFKIVSSSIKFFTVNTTLTEMVIFNDIITAEKTLPPVGLNLMQEIITGLAELNWHGLWDL